MRIAARLARIERRLAARAAGMREREEHACAVCRPAGTDPVTGKPRPVWRIAWADPAEPMTPAQMHCPACGRRSVYRIQFDQAG